MPEPNVVNVTLQEVVDSLHNAAKLGDLKKSGIITAAVDEMPSGIDITKLGQEAMDHLESLPQNHLLRTGLDLERMKKGLSYLKDGTVTISHYRAKGINEGDKIQVDYNR